MSFVFNILTEAASEAYCTLTFISPLNTFRNNDKVGLICFSDRIEAYIPPRKGSKHVLRVIRELLALEPESRGTDLASALEFLGKVQKKRSIVFLVSDMQDRNWQKQLQIANRRHDVVVVSTEDSAESKLPKVGLMRIEDPETGKSRVIDTSSTRVRKAWQQLAEERQIAVEQTLRRCSVDQIRIKTGEPFTNALRQFFRRREGRRSA